jgi:hypothetical protein
LLVNIATGGVLLGGILAALALPSFARGGAPLTTDPSDCDAYCYTRWDIETKACSSRSVKNYSGCIERANNRRNLCVSNGGQATDDEPPEWGPLDE